MGSRSLAAGAVLGADATFEEWPARCCRSTGGTCGVRPTEDRTTTNRGGREASPLHQSRWRTRSRTRISDALRSRSSAGRTAW